MHRLRRGSTTRAAIWEEASHHGHTGEIRPTTSPAPPRAMEPRPKVNARRSLWRRRGRWGRRRRGRCGGGGEVGGEGSGGVVGAAFRSGVASRRGRGADVDPRLATSMAWSVRRLGEVGSGSGGRDGERIRRPRWGADPARVAEVEEALDGGEVGPPAADVGGGDGGDGQSGEGAGDGRGAAGTGGGDGWSQQ